MGSAKDNDRSFLDDIYWLNHDETELLKQVLHNGEEDLFTYVLPQRSHIETKINKVPEILSLNNLDEQELDELVYRYNMSIAAALDSVDNWMKSRDIEQFTVDSLLYLEGMELQIALHSLEVLKTNGRALFEFLQLHKV